jgi:hypothetical protein
MAGGADQKARTAQAGQQRAEIGHSGFSIQDPATLEQNNPALHFGRTERAEVSKSFRFWKQLSTQAVIVSRW